MFFRCLRYLPAASPCSSIKKPQQRQQQENCKLLLAGTSNYYSNYYSSLTKHCPNLHFILQCRQAEQRQQQQQQQQWPNQFLCFFFVKVLFPFFGSCLCYFVIAGIRIFGAHYFSSQRKLGVRSVLSIWYSW